MSGDWAPLADTDPTPGDPEALVGVAEQLEGVAAAAEDATAVADVAVDDIWIGIAARRFAEARAQVLPALRAVAGRCGDAAAALRWYAAALTEAQQQARAALALARAAAADEQLALELIRRSRLWVEEHPGEPWPGRDGAALLAAAREELHHALRLLEDARDRHAASCQAATRTLRAATEDLLEDPWYLAPVVPLASWLLGTAATATFVRAADRLVLNTRESWRAEAYRRAGIDPQQWRPERGIADLDVVAQSAWDFYGTLFLGDPGRYLWAGMAKVAAGTIYAALQDLHVLQTVGEREEEAMEQMRRVVVDRALRDLLSDLADGAEEMTAVLALVERMLLSMQRQIFDDLAWQHLAFEAGGVEALLATGAVPDHVIEAWRQIESGDGAAVAEGNRTILRREQLDVIGDDYDRMRDESGLLAWLLTIVMSWSAESPIPGGRPFREVVPMKPEIRVPLPGEDPAITFPEGALPGHNVTIFEHRWRWIEEDLYPAWLRLVDSGAAQHFAAIPVAELAAFQRQIPDQLLAYRPSVRAPARQEAPAPHRAPRAGVRSGSRTPEAVGR